MNRLSLYLRGIVIGFASLAVPGLSASTIAIVLLVYYDMIYAISHIFSKPKKSIPFLLVLLAGYGTGAIGGAIAVNTLYVRFPLPVIGAVLGFLIGSIPRIVVENRKDFKKPANILIMAIVATLFLLYSLVITDGESVSFDTIRIPLDFIIMGFVGIITSTTLVIPGVDFAVTLMALGYYYGFIELVGDFSALFLQPARLFLLLSYLIGYGVGSFLFSKGLRYLIKRYPRQLNSVNTAMVLIAPIIVVEKCILENPNVALYSTWPQIFWAMVLFIAGFFAYSWMPMFLRYIGLAPKDAVGTAAEEMAAATSKEEAPPAP